MAHTTTAPPGSGLPLGPPRIALPDAAAVEPAAAAHSAAVQAAKRKLGWFSWFAHETARLSGRPITFLIATATIAVWAVTGPLFDYSDSWQLVINTGTTIVTFLMVFLIQNTQNRDTLALQIKLSELIIAMRGAENKVAAVEDLGDEELEALHREIRQARRADARDADQAPPRPATADSGAFAARRPPLICGSRQCHR